MKKNMKPYVIQIIVTITLALFLTESLFFINKDLPQSVIDHAIGLGWTKMNTFFLMMILSSPVGLVLAMFYDARAWGGL